MKKQTLYTKDYFEEYARLCLNDMFNLELVFRSERYNDNPPDLISKDEKTGVEATRGITEEEARHDKLFQYEDYPQDENRNKLIQERSKALNIEDSLRFVNEIAALSQSYDKESTIIKIKKSITDKLKKLNKPHYSIYKSNYLFIFRALSSSSDIIDIASEILKLQKIFAINYNRIYLLNEDELYCIQKNKIDKFIISSEKLKLFKINAKVFAKNKGVNKY